jgi:alpha-ketoglutarate-dependent taurine dioxygenase
MYCPIIGGSWNMTKFTADVDSGKTYFFDSSLAYSMLEEEEQAFLSKCHASWYSHSDIGPHFAPAVAPHWISNKKVIRLELSRSIAINLFSFDGRRPTDGESDTFKDLTQKIHDIIENEETCRIVHRWNQGDIVFPDLFRMAHSVTGGFSPEDREFSGMWLFSKDVESESEDPRPVGWR